MNLAIQGCKGMGDVGFGAAMMVGHTLERLKKKKILGLLRSLLGTRGLSDGNLVVGL